MARPAGNAASASRTPSSRSTRRGFATYRRRGGGLSMLSPASASGGNWVSPARTTAARSSAPGPSLVFSPIRSCQALCMPRARRALGAQVLDAGEQVHGTGEGPLDLPADEPDDPVQATGWALGNLEDHLHTVHLRPGAGGAAHAKRVVRRARPARRVALLPPGTPPGHVSKSRVSHDPTLRFTCILSVVSPEAICSGGYSRSRGRRRS